MGKLRVFESVSVDGYCASPGGDMDWAYEGSDDPEYNAWVGGNASSGGALLFGRVTYEMMAAFWPTPLAARQMPEVARGMNAATKYVATRSLEPRWSNSQRLEGDLAGAVAELKARSDSGITVLGSPSVARQLGEAGLVDEYQFVIVPVALGDGSTAFSAARRLSVIEQRSFPNGRIAVTYAAAR